MEMFFFRFLREKETFSSRLCGNVRLRCYDVLALINRLTFGDKHLRCQPLTAAAAARSVDLHFGDTDSNRKVSTDVQLA